MAISVDIEQLIHVAIDAESGFINQHLLIKLLEFITTKANINKLTVSFSENDRAGAECCKFIEENNLKQEKKITLGKNAGMQHIDEAILFNPTKNTKSTYVFETYESSEESIYRHPSKAIISEEDLIEDNKATGPIPSTLNLDQLLEEDHAYYLQKNDVPVIADIIDKLNGKIQKISSVIKKLQKSIKKCHAVDTDYSSGSEINVFKEIAFGDMGTAFEITKHDYNRSKFDENLKNLEISAKGDLFIELFGRVQKKKDLHMGLSVLQFREIDLDYRTNFQTIHAFLELHRGYLKKIQSDIEIIKRNDLAKEEFMVFKEAISSSHNQMKNDIKDYILRDPEATGIIKFKEGSCISCGRPARMKTTSSPPISAKEDESKKLVSRQSCKILRTDVKQSREESPTMSVKFGETGHLCNVVDLPTDQMKHSSKKINWEYRLKRIQIIHKGNPNIQNSVKDLQQIYVKPKKIWK